MEKRQRLIETLIRDTGMDRESALSVMNSFVAVIRQNAKRGITTRISYFGEFTVVRRKGRMIRSIRNGVQIRIRPKKVVKFRMYREERRRLLLGTLRAFPWLYGMIPE